MILLDQGDVQTGIAKHQIARNAGAVNAAAHNQDVPLFGLQTADILCAAIDHEMTKGRRATEQDHLFAAAGSSDRS